MKKIGIIDLGSNYIRLIIVNTENNYFFIEDEIKDYIKLSDDLFSTGYLRPSKIQHIVRTIKMYKKMCDNNNVSEVIAFIDCALSRAKNIKSFLEELEVMSGYTFRTLDEQETTELIYLGVINSLDVPKGIIFQITGGNIHLICFNKKTIINRYSFHFGSSLLFVEYDHIVGQEQMNCFIRRLVHEYSKVDWLKKMDSDVEIVCVGGAMRNLAKVNRMLNKNPFDMIHNTEISLKEFDNILNMINSVDIDKRSKIRGLSSEKVETFLISLAALRALLKICKKDKFVISACGIREGLIFKRLSNVSDRNSFDVFNESIIKKIAEYNENYNHVMHVCFLAMSLFKQLKGIHKMPKSYTKVLKIASLLHDSGNLFKYSDRRNHSFYFILNSNLYGAKHREIILAAFVARFTSFEDFSMQDWNSYKAILHKEDLVAVFSLGVILRIAESLDKCMSNSVQNLTCDILGDSVIIKTISGADSSLEIKDAMKNSKEFARAFNKNLEIL